MGYKKHVKKRALIERIELMIPTLKKQEVFESLYADGYDVVLQRCPIDESDKKVLCRDITKIRIIAEREVQS